ncbi:MAG: hypothetical protein ACKOPG_07635 [Novosphingobium sp.]
MIQPAACLSLPALALPADAAGPAAGEGAEGADFGALLALQGQAAVPEGDAAVPSSALPDVAAAATAPASPGKILPPVFPALQSAPPPAQAGTIKPGGPAAPMPAQARKERSLARPEAKTAANEEPLENPDAPAAAPVQPTPAHGTAALPDPAARVTAEPEQAAFRDRAAGSGQLNSAAPPLLARVLTYAPSSAQAARLSHAQAGGKETPVSLPSPQAALQPAAAAFTRPAEEVRIALALPRSPAAPQLAGEGKAASPDSPTEPAAALSLSGSAAPAPTSPALSIQAAPQIRPHDFAALIDRLSAARDAVQPQAVSITVAHHDFGPVRLHFRPDEAGLSVAMSSADPEFARAAAAAPPAVLPVNASAEASFGQSRSDGAAGQTGTPAGGGQSRGASNGQRDGHGQPRANPSPRGQQQRPAQRPGIFA